MLLVTGVYRDGLMISLCELSVNHTRGPANMTPGANQWSNLTCVSSDNDKLL